MFAWSIKHISNWWYCMLKRSRVSDGGSIWRNSQPKSLKKGCRNDPIVSGVASDQAIRPAANPIPKNTKPDAAERPIVPKETTCIKRKQPNNTDTTNQTNTCRALGLDYLKKGCDRNVFL